VWVKPPDSWRVLADTLKASAAPMAVTYLDNLREGGCGDGGCRWHLFDPRTGRDELLVTLPDRPKDIAWDMEFKRVAYRAGDSLYELSWTRGARPRVVWTLPATMERKYEIMVW